MFDGEAFGLQIVDLVKGYVERQLAPLLERMAQLEARELPPSDMEDRLLSETQKRIDAAIDALPAPAAPEIDLRGVERIVADAVAALPAPKDGESVDMDVVEQMLRDMVTTGLEALPKPAEIDMGEVERLVEDTVAAIPAPKDGESVDMAAVEAMLRDMVADGLEALPKPADVDMGEVGRMVADAVAALPVPKDGESVDMAAVEAMLHGIVAAAVEQLPLAKDGIGLSGALIDRTGHLVLTLTDGRHVDLGAVVGKDVDMDEVRQLVKAEVDAIPRPKDGRNAFELEDFDVSPAGDGRTVTLSFTRGDVGYEFDLKFPVPIYREVWREKDESGAPVQYEPGDMVTWGGSLWHCDQKTTEKPGVGPWRLAVKKGRDGKDSAK